MKNICGIDFRSLAAFRIILATFIALEFGLMVLGNFSDIYSPQTGILGNDFAKDYLTYYKNFEGIFFIHSDSGMKLFIWLIIITMFLLAAGFYPRLMAAIGCMLLYLFFNRYNLLYFGWEMYASVMLFWLIWLPSNNRYSLFQTAYIINNNEWKSPFAFALLFQIGFIYFYNGISKNGDLWMSGLAVDSFLSETDKTTDYALWLKNKQTLSSFLTYATLFVEIAVLPMLFIRWNNSFFRYVAALLIVVLHWSIALFADVGNFKYVAVAVAFLLLPGSFWEFFAAPKNNLEHNENTSFVIKLPTFNTSLPFLMNSILATLLCLIIIFTNLSQTNTSKTSDRVKKIIQTLHIDKPLAHFNHYSLPQYSFFTQYWHLYSPDPPAQKGYMQAEVITVNNDTIPVFSGMPLNGKRFYSDIQHYFFSGLLLKQGRNEKEKITEKYLMLREIRLWNKQKTNAKLKSLQLVIYGFSYDKAVSANPVSSRNVYKSIDIKYKS